MKKNPIILIILATLLGLVTSCATDELVNPNPEGPPGGNGQQITITAKLGDANSNNKPGTRMGYTPDDAGTGLKTTWAENDAFNIVPFEDWEKTAHPFTLTSVDPNTGIGTFTGTEPTEGTTYYNVYHPTSITEEDQFNAFSYTGQVQAGNNDPKHLTAKHSIRLTGLTDYKTIDFSSPTAQSSCMKFVLTLPVGITPTKITLASADGSPCFYSNNDGSTTAANLSLGLTGFASTGISGGTITAYMMMSCKDVTLPEAGIIVTVTSLDESRYDKTIATPLVDGKTVVLEGGKTHTITATQMTLVSTTYTDATVASTFLYTADGTTIKPGTTTNPYLIQSAGDLKMVQEITNGVITNDTYKNKCYKLTTDITIALPTGTSWTPIGKDYDDKNNFQGTFDGDGHSVTGVYINTDQTYQGFFGYINKGTVKNLNVTGDITSTYTHSNSNGLVGGIVGNLYGNSYVIGCSYSGSITGTGAGTKIGGICGSVYDSYVIGCYNTSAVKITSQQNGLYCGGIAGITGSGNVRIIGCYNTGAVTGTDNTRVGGIVAINQGKVMGCYNTGSVTGTNVSDASCGGILGRSVQDVTTGCLWVKSDASGTAAKGIGESSDGTSYAGIDIDPFAAIATLNNDTNIGILNAAIDTWNSDTKGPKGDTTSPKYCHFKFKAGTDDATPPTLATEIP